MTLFYAVRIDFGDRVANIQYKDLRTAEVVLVQAQARYGHDNVCIVEVCG